METAQRAHPRQPRANPPCTVCQNEARSHKALVRVSRRVQRGETGSVFMLPLLLQSHKPLCPVEVVFELQQQGAKASGKGRGVCGSRCKMSSAPDTLLSPL